MDSEAHLPCTGCRCRLRHSSPSETGLDAEMVVNGSHPVGIDPDRPIDDVSNQVGFLLGHGWGDALILAGLNGCWAPFPLLDAGWLA